MENLKFLNPEFFLCNCTFIYLSILKRKIPFHGCSLQGIKKVTSIEMSMGWEYLSFF